MRKGLIFGFFFISLSTSLYFFRDSFEILNLFNQKKINNILIYNNKYFTESYFVSKLSIFEGESFYKFNPYKLKKELDKIDEIQSFKFEMNLDGILTIIINEKKPFMLWHKENKYVFIDDEGNTLNYNYYPDDKFLLNVYGENADKYISSLKNYLNSRIFKKLIIQKIYFNENLGWKFYIKNSKCLYFPIKKLDKMMNISENIIVSDLFKKYSLFDFRISGRVYMSNNEC